MSYAYPVIVDQPRIKLKAIGRRAGSDGGHGGSSKLQVHELLGEAYTVLSLVGIVGVLIYHIAG